MTRAAPTALVCLLSLLPAPLAGQARAAPAPAGDWPAAGRDPALSRFSPLDRISTANVGELRPVWSFSTGALGAHEGNPLVVDGMMYVHTPFPNAVHALDLSRPGAPLAWSWSVPAATARLTVPAGCCDTGSRGLAWHPAGRLYVPLFHGELAALDARTGREIWRVQNADRASGGSVPGAPLVAGDLVIIGTGGAEFGVRGHLTAYHAATGQLAWRAWHTGPDADVLLDGDANPNYGSHRGRDLGVTTWSGDQWRRGGATAPGWIAHDPAAGLLFYGTDHPAPRNAALRPGDNKWAATIFARSAATGRVRWALQLTPHDEWGYGAANETILADLTLGGTTVKALVHVNANGFVYAIDRESGRLLSASRIGPANWARYIDPGSATPVRDPQYATAPTRVSGICPASAGMKGLGPAAWSPPTGRLFVPLNNLCMSLQQTAIAYTPGRPYTGATIRMTAGPGGNRGRFVAYDPATGAIAWQVQEPYAVLSGTLVTAGGLVFYGTMDGWLKALDQATGRELWRFRTPSGIVGSPITFLGPDDRQYVAVLSGIGGWLGQGGNGAFADLGTISTRGGVLTVFGR
jgi:lanthanide-dependent methanol dehydrogenase